MERHIGGPRFKDAMTARSSLAKHLQYARNNVSRVSGVRLVELPRGQILANDTLKNGSMNFCLVCEGVVGQTSVFHDGRRQILNFCFPGEVLIPDFTPNLPEVSAYAMSDTILLIATRKTVDVIAAKSNRFRTAFLEAMSVLQERSAFHNMVLGRLRQNERLATFLLEAGLWSGRPSRASAIMLDLPMTREDIGDYLGLNAATVTRGLTSLKQNGLIETVGPKHIRIPDMEELALITPVADALVDIYIALTNVFGPDPEHGPSQCLLSGGGDPGASTH